MLRFGFDKEYISIQKLEEHFKYDITHQQFVDNFNYLSKKKYLVKCHDFLLHYELSKEARQIVIDSINAQNENNVRQNLEVENLKLQNESFKYENSIRDKQQEIDKLTIENLKLQNRQLKRYILYSVIGVIFGIVISEYKEILIFLKAILPLENLL